jgi:hypothetical protein
VSAKLTPSIGNCVYQSVAEELHFFEQLRVWMAAFPPAARDIDHQRRFEPLGLLDRDSPYADPDRRLAAVLRAGIEQGRAELEHALRNSPAPKQNGWSLTYHAFDYNLDFFELGALDDPGWKVDLDPPVRYMLAQPPPVAASGETTAMRPPTPWSTKTAMETS